MQPLKRKVVLCTAILITIDINDSNDIIILSGASAVSKPTLFIISEHSFERDLGRFGSVSQILSTHQSKKGEERRKCMDPDRS